MYGRSLEKGQQIRLWDAWGSRWYPGAAESSLFSRKNSALCQHSLQRPELLLRLHLPERAELRLCHFSGLKRFLTAKKKRKLGLHTEALPYMCSTGVRCFSNAGEQGPRYWNMAMLWVVHWQRCAESLELEKKGCCRPVLKGVKRSVCGAYDLISSLLKVRGLWCIGCGVDGVHSTGTLHPSILHTMFTWKTNTFLETFPALWIKVSWQVQYLLTCQRALIWLTTLSSYNNWFQSV